MNKYIIIFALFTTALSFGQKLSIPKGYEIIIEKTGDLNKDGILEKVIVYNTSDTTEYGNVREIQILKQRNGQWIVWKTSRHAILKSDEGGAMGDPFEGIEIKNGILSINFSGGSSWKWRYTDKYRFQNNEFELIGYTSTYGKLCEYWAGFDFNISTGKIVYKKAFENCDKDQDIYKTENETFYKKGIHLNLNNRNLKKVKIISPKYRRELSL